MAWDMKFQNFWSTLANSDEENQMVNSSLWMEHVGLFLQASFKQFKAFIDDNSLFFRE